MTIDKRQGNLARGPADESGSNLRSETPRELGRVRYLTSGGIHQTVPPWPAGPDHPGSHNTVTSPALDVPSNGLPCPPWCHSGHDPRQAHTGDVGGFWLREHRTGTGRTVRAAGGLISVVLEQELDLDGPLDEVVRLDRVGATPGSPAKLSSGEARQFAALLMAAADRADRLP